jgi:uncharacterized protein with PIN domain
VSNNTDRFSLLIMFVDGSAQVAYASDESKVRAAVHRIIERPEGIVSLTAMHGARLLAGMTFERMPAHLLN